MSSLREIAVKYSCDKDDLGYTKHYENKQCTSMEEFKEQIQSLELLTKVQ